MDEEIKEEKSKLPIFLAILTTIGFITIAVTLSFLCSCSMSHTLETSFMHGVGKAVEEIGKDIEEVSIPGSVSKPKTISESTQNNKETQ